MGDLEITIRWATWISLSDGRSGDHYQMGDLEISIRWALLKEVNPIAVLEWIRKQVLEIPVNEPDMVLGFRQVRQWPYINHAFDALQFNVPKGVRNIVTRCDHRVCLQRKGK